MLNRGELRNLFDWIFSIQQESTVRFNWFLRYAKFKKATPLSLKLSLVNYEERIPNSMILIGWSNRRHFWQVVFFVLFSIQNHFWAGNSSYFITMHLTSSDLRDFFLLLSRYDFRQQMMVKFRSQQILWLIYIKPHVQILSIIQSHWICINTSSVSCYRLCLVAFIVFADVSIHTAQGLV